MFIIDTIQSFISNLQLPVLVIIGIMTFIALFAGKLARIIKLPSLIGFMIAGVILGPSLVNILNDPLQEHLSFITEIALGFVAFGIGLELSLKILKQQGSKMILIIFAESFLAFILVTGSIYILTRDLALALIFGAIAPASAPAGTVAVIQEYKASGSLTKALYTVVGFDDGLGIIIFGFAAAIAKSIISSSSSGLFMTIFEPIKEVFLSFGIGGLVSIIYCLIARKLKSATDIFIFTFSAILTVIGLCTVFHLSLILTNMIFGIVVINTQPAPLVEKIHQKLKEIMPLLFVLFFVLAGANLHISILPSLGIIGVVYFVARSAGLMGGAWLGAMIGKAEDKIRKYLGMGILSQAGVAIGLSLIIKHEFSKINAWGESIGSIVITSITATCILFEILGPILTKIALKKAGEIK
ncbi:MAG: cation:proton antiporter [Spirochaetales bacterium]|nr:cation:proton antiporter [Spirochaetales bacterium]